MSAQAPLTREALSAWASVDDASITCRLARSALAYMDTLDAVIVERDEAYRQRDEAKADLGTVRAQLSAELADASAIRRASGAKSGEPTIMAVAKSLESQIGDARAILGARPDELLSDAAARAVSDADRLRALASIVGLSELATWDDLAALLRGRAEAELTRLREGRMRGVRELLGARDGESVLSAVDRLLVVLGAGEDESAMDAAQRTMGDLAHHASMRHEVARVAGMPNAVAATWGDIVARVMHLAAEAEPPQTFRPPISVIVRHACDHPFAEVGVGAIQDPAFLALPMGVRLGLVVIRD